MYITKRTRETIENLIINIKADNIEKDEIISTLTDLLLIGQPIQKEGKTPGSQAIPGHTLSLAEIFVNTAIDVSKSHPEIKLRDFFLQFMQKMVNRKLITHELYKKFLAEIEA